MQLFRETLEAAIIVSVLLALVEQLVSGKKGSSSSSDSDGDTTIKHSPTGYDSISTDYTEPNHQTGPGGAVNPTTTEAAINEHHDEGRDKNGRTPEERRLLKKLRIQIFAGAGAGLLVALAV